MAGGDETLATTLAVQKLCSRVLDDELRSQISDFVAFTGFATTGAVRGWGPSASTHARRARPSLRRMIREQTYQVVR